MSAGTQYGELDGLNWSCGFMHSATAPACGRDAVWHGFHITDDGDIAFMTACCDGHLPVMKLSAEYTHAMDSPCGLPGSKFVWPENHCFLPDTEDAIAGVGVAFAVVGVAG